MPHGGAVRKLCPNPYNYPVFVVTTLSVLDCTLIRNEHTLPKSRTKHWYCLALVTILNRNISHDFTGISIHGLMQNAMVILKSLVLFVFAKFTIIFLKVLLIYSIFLFTGWNPTWSNPSARKSDSSLAKDRLFSPGTLVASTLPYLTDAIQVKEFWLKRETPLFNSTRKIMLS